MKFYVVRKQGETILRPAYQEDIEQLVKMRTGEVYRAEVKMPRNIKFHRKFFTLINLIMENMPEDHQLTTVDGQPLQIRNSDDLLWHIKMQVGHYERKVTLGGKVVYEAKSISFGAMDEAEFDKFYNAAVDAVCKYILPGISREDLIDIVAVSYT